jgi:hypothetical protein
MPNHALHPTRLRRSRAAAGAGERGREADTNLKLGSQTLIRTR